MKKPDIVGQIIMTNDSEHIGLVKDANEEIAWVQWSDETVSSIIIGNDDYHILDCCVWDYDSWIDGGLSDRQMEGCFVSVYVPHLGGRGWNTICQDCFKQWLLNEVENVEYEKPEDKAERFDVIRAISMQGLE